MKNLNSEIRTKIEETEEYTPINPAHYRQGDVECLDAIKAATTNLVGFEAVCTGHIMRYVWRWKIKNGIEDLKKAQFYLNELISEVEKNERHGKMGEPNIKGGDKHEGIRDRGRGNRQGHHLRHRRQRERGRNRGIQLRYRVARSG